MISHQAKNDVEEAIKLSKKPDSMFQGFSQYSASFLFGTENQEGINTILNYSGKNVLTPASSGDHYVSAVYYGADNVDTFDINRMTYYFMCLKIAAIIALDYEEFISFFAPQDENGKLRPEFWNLCTLKRLISFMPNDIAYFWDKVMFEVKRNNYGLFTNPKDSRFTLDNIKSGMPFYKDKKEYYILQRKLRHRAYPKFYESDVLDLGSLLDTQYDILYLSNIIECLVCNELFKYYMPPYYYEDMFEKEKFEAIVENPSSFLKENGIILMSYRPNIKTSGDWFATSGVLDVHTIPCKVPPTGEYHRQDNVDMVFTYKPKRK